MHGMIALIGDEARDRHFDAEFDADKHKEKADVQENIFEKMLACDTKAPGQVNNYRRVQRPDAPAERILEFVRRVNVRFPDQDRDVILDVNADSKDDPENEDQQQQPFERDIERV